MVERMTLQEMKDVAAAVGSVDGIPIDLDHYRMNYRPGLFTIKEDLESPACRLAERDGVGHLYCVATQAQSSDGALKSAQMQAMYVAKTLTVDAFDDYDEARWWPHP
jgi:hypothetical protein